MPLAVSVCHDPLVLHNKQGEMRLCVMHFCTKQAIHIQDNQAINDSHITKCYITQPLANMAGTSIFSSNAES
jgi:hypothetical protein